jgi:uncharacterized protein (AIM24 family)
MAALPNLIPARDQARFFGDVAYFAGEEAVPVLTIDVSKTAVYFEHHTLLWKHPSVKITLRAEAGGRRLPGGEHARIAEASGDGMIAFSRDEPGRVAPLHMPLGREIVARENHFLAATRLVRHSSEQAKGAASLLHAGHGYAIDKFHSDKGDGVLWLYAYGHVLEKVLKDGESIDVDPAAWLYKETSVRMETVTDRLASGKFGAHVNMFVNRFTGPGRVGVQSMYRHGPAES